MKIKLFDAKMDQAAAGFLLGLLMFVIFALNPNRDRVLMLAILVSVSLYDAILILRTNFQALNALFSAPMLWYAAIWTLSLAYGLFAPYPEDFSLIFHVFNLAIMILFVILAYGHRKHFYRLFLGACVVSAVALMAYVLLHNQKDLAQFLPQMLAGGEIHRLGRAGTGNVNSTALAYLSVSIPILYAMFKDGRIYLWILIPILLGVLLTGSKKGIFGIFFAWLMLNSKFAKKTVSYYFRILALLIIVPCLLYFVPFLHNAVWERISAMVSTILHGTTTEKTSTSLRLYFILTALENWWTKPLFGHGWYMFAHFDQYGMYSHCNYTELLFTFGLPGFIVYYCFPVFLFIKGRRQRKSFPVVFTFLVISLVSEIAAVTFYDSVRCYMVYISCYYLLDYLKYQPQMELIEGVSV